MYLSMFIYVYTYYTNYSIICVYIYIYIYMYMMSEQYCTAALPCSIDCRARVKRVDSCRASSSRHLKCARCLCIRVLLRYQCTH